MLQVPPIIPSGPAWAVAITLIFAGLAFLLRTSLPLIAAIRKNGNGPKSALAENALGRAEAIAEIKVHLDTVSEEARDHREKIMGNIDKTRHDLANPLTTATLSLALIEQTLIEIRDRLSRGAS